jgi:hypothetical protein
MRAARQAWAPQRRAPRPRSEVGVRGLQLGVLQRVHRRLVEVVKVGVCQGLLGLRGWQVRGGGGEGEAGAGEGEG